MVTQRSSLFVCNFICSLCFSDSALSMKTRIQWCQDFVDKLILKYHVTTHFCCLNIFHLSHFILCSKHKDSNPGSRAEGWRTGWRWLAPTVVLEKERPELSVMSESPDLSSVSAIKGYVVITEVRQSEVTAQMKLCMAIPSL